MAYKQSPFNFYDKENGKKDPEDQKNWTGKEKSGSKAETKAFKKDRNEALKKGKLKEALNIQKDVKSSKKARKDMKKRFKGKVKDLKKANKTQAGQSLKQVGPSSYQNIHNNVVYSDPKGVTRKTKGGLVMDDDLKQRKGKFVKNKSKPRGTRRNSK